jgi:hypothetical protein
MSQGLFLWRSQRGRIEKLGNGGDKLRWREGLG